MNVEMSLLIEGLGAPRDITEKHLAFLGLQAFALLFYGRVHPDVLQRSAIRFCVPIIDLLPTCSVLMSASGEVDPNSVFPDVASLSGLAWIAFMSVSTLVLKSIWLLPVTEKLATLLEPLRLCDEDDAYV